MTDYKKDRARIYRHLTQREGEILELVLKGYTNPQIAIRLETTEQMVKQAMGLIFIKKSVKSRVMLVSKVLTERHSEELKKLSKPFES